MANASVESARHRDFTAFQEHNQRFHRTIVAAANNSVLLKTWDSLFFQVRTRFTMDYLASADPVAIAREHRPIADSLHHGDPDLAASLLASHSNHLVQFLQAEQRQRGEAAAPGRRVGRPANHGSSKLPPTTRE